MISMIATIFRGKKLYNQAMRPYLCNPRRITRKQAARLKETMTEFGDLSGIVHDLSTDEVISGNQRSLIAQLLNREPVITERFDPPQPDGTSAIGYFDFNGRRFGYRAVTGWDEEKRQRANLVANAAGGSWDVDLLANMDAALLQGIGFDEELLAANREMASAMAAMLESEKPQISQNITELFLILVDCETEAAQVELLERFNEEGLKCRALIS